MSKTLSLHNINFSQRVGEVEKLPRVLLKNVGTSSAQSQDTSQPEVEDDWLDQSRYLR